MTFVRYQSSDHVATITMDRASVHNALNNVLCDELRRAWQCFRESDDRVAVLASSEEKYFCVGADVRDFPVNMWHAVPGLGIELDKPVIAATSGWVVGGGVVLVQMADLCVASETTRDLARTGRRNRRWDGHTLQMTQDLCDDRLLSDGDNDPECAAPAQGVRDHRKSPCMAFAVHLVSGSGSLCSLW